MNRTLAHINQSVVFTQWSRKSYAVFSSLGKEIQIGHLDVEICEKAIEKKSSKRSFKKEWIDTSLSIIDDQDDLILLNSDLQLISTIVETLNSDDSSRPCCKQNSINKFRKLIIRPVSQDANNCKII